MDCLVSLCVVVVYEAGEFCESQGGAHQIPSLGSFIVPHTLPLVQLGGTD